MVVLMLNRVRRVSVSEASRAVATELGNKAAGTVRAIGANSATMSYLEWRVGATPYHLGTSSEPYLPVFGVGKVDSESRVVGPMKWTMREEVPPEGEEFCNAWVAHTAWLYVDALLFHPTARGDDTHLRSVLRISSHFIDERCVLVWLWGREPKQVALPTAGTIEAMSAGRWPT